MEDINKINSLFSFLIKKHENNKYYLDIIFNILLVCHGIRPSFLFEEHNYIEKIDDPEKFLNFLVKLINIKLEGLLTLKKTKDTFTFPRIFVYLDEESLKKLNYKIFPVDKLIKENKNATENDYTIAQMLGFNCVGHNYSNYHKNRISLSFFLINNNEKEFNEENEINIITEVCDEEKINIETLQRLAEEFKNKVNNVINLKFNYSCYYRIKYIYSVDYRFQKLLEKNVEFIEKHIDEYIDDIGNFYIPDEKIVHQSTTFKKIKDIKNTITKEEEYIFLVKKFNYILNRTYENIKEPDDTYESIKEEAKINLEKDINDWKEIEGEKKDINLVSRKIHSEKNISDTIRLLVVESELKSEREHNFFLKRHNYLLQNKYDKFVKFIEEMIIKYRISKEDIKIYTNILIKDEDYELLRGDSFFKLSETDLNRNLENRDIDSDSVVDSFLKSSETDLNRHLENRHSKYRSKARGVRDSKVRKHKPSKSRSRITRIPSEVRKHRSRSPSDMELTVGYDTITPRGFKILKPKKEPPSFKKFGE